MVKIILDTFMDVALASIFVAVTLAMIYILIIIVKAIRDELES